MLYVSECFGPTEQGEGKTAGKEVMFLRLAYCNLKCVFCDTPYTWQAKLLKTEVHKMTIEDVITKLQNRKVIKSIVISGGEPLLQQKELISLCKWLRSTNWWIEIETNGTILPNKELVNLVNQFNCSPKLSNSGNIKPQNPKAQHYHYYGKIIEVRRNRHVNGHNTWNVKRWNGISSNPIFTASDLSKFKGCDKYELAKG